MSDADAFAARRAEISKIEAESTQSSGLRSDVITLYQGGQYNLYRYKKYTDIRLVFVPGISGGLLRRRSGQLQFPALQYRHGAGARLRKRPAGATR
jgi:hypothetical protein